jgi:hypothetical protein
VNGAPDGALFLAEASARSDLPPLGPAEDPLAVLQAVVESFAAEVGLGGHLRYPLRSACLYYEAF